MKLCAVVVWYNPESVEHPAENILSYAPYMDAERFFRTETITMISGCTIYCAIRSICAGHTPLIQKSTTIQAIYCV